MFENDRSVARGLMNKASAQDLFDCMKIRRVADPAKATRGSYPMQT
ncbi:MAG: hypothetical protein LWX23_11560 [Spirochaetia bacterium]|jgi:hypothetical protein|nr:hypothetical protein [Spirochaetia bacterium]MCE1210091.1 hypothetical protein [Spirochaetia bacterium]